MATVTMSSKNQITIPVEIVRAMGLKPGDKLIAEAMDWRIVLMPQPDSWTDDFAGSLKGVYGSTKEEIDRYIAEVREGPERWEWRQQFDDLVSTNEDVRRLVPHFREAPHGLHTLDELTDLTALDAHRVGKALEKLLNHGSVRLTHVSKPGRQGERQMYRLVHEFVSP